MHLDMPSAVFLAALVFIIVGHGWLVGKGA